MILETLDRFWSHVKLNPSNGCWEWQNLTGKSRGSIRVNGRKRSSHRWILEQREDRSLHRWELACHRCDNIKCVNLSHLYVGTSQSNMDDKMERSRYRNQWSDRDTCKYGHRFTLSNTLINKTTGNRYCKPCHYSRQKKYRSKDVEITDDQQ